MVVTATSTPQSPASVKEATEVATPALVTSKRRSHESARWSVSRGEPANYLDSSDFASSSDFNESVGGAD